MLIAGKEGGGGWGDDSLTGNQVSYEGCATHSAKTRWRCSTEEKNNKLRLLMSVFTVPMRKAS